MERPKNLLRALSMKNVEGYDELDDYEKDCFDEIYGIHLDRFQSKRAFKAHTDQHIEKIEKKNTLLIVYFDHGKKYIYNLEVKKVLDKMQEKKPKNKLRKLLIQEL